MITQVDVKYFDQCFSHHLKRKDSHTYIFPSANVSRQTVISNFINRSNKAGETTVTWHYQDVHPKPVI